VLSGSHLPDDKRSVGDLVADLAESVGASLFHMTLCRGGPALRNVRPRVTGVRCRWLAWHRQLLSLLLEFQLLGCIIIARLAHPSPQKC
jgi:hypothetical protein